MRFKIGDKVKVNSDIENCRFVAYKNKICKICLDACFLTVPEDPCNLCIEQKYLTKVKNNNWDEEKL